MTREEAIERLEFHKKVWLMVGGIDICEVLDMAISALKEQPRWISVEERLPSGWWVDPETGYSEPEEYIVFVKGATLPTFANYIDGKFTRPDAVYTQSEDVFADVVTHWMPLPEPPGVEV